MVCRKIGLDFHGVISASPEFFRQMAEYIKSTGGEVYVISGGPRLYIENFLKQNRIPYDKLWCVIDVPEVNEKTEFFADGSFRVDDDLWDKAKSIYCRAENVDLHIDDSSVYGKYFSTQYCRYDKSDNSFYLNNCTLRARKFTKQFFRRLMSCANLEVD